jgi:hypothetical protein
LNNILDQKHAKFSFQHCRQIRRICRALGFLRPEQTAHLMARASI